MEIITTIQKIDA